MSTIVIDPATRIIYVPQSYLTHTDGETHSGIHIYEMDVDTFRLDLKAWEASEDGMFMPDTHRHNPEVVLGGITYARTVEMINGYSILFEEMTSPQEHYMVRLVGANNNLAEVADLHGQVSMLTNNAAGLTSAVNPQDYVEQAIIENNYSLQEAMRLVMAMLLGKVSGAGTGIETFRDTTDSVDRAIVTVDSSGNRSSVVLDPSG